MRLVKHLNEAKTPSVQFVLESIYKHSRKFLDESGIPTNPRYMCFSGRTSHREPFFIGRIRKDRRPVDTEMEDHKKWDAAFKEKFGWNARSNALFCTGNKSKAIMYGDVYMIFPIKRYMYIWSPKIGDLFRFITSKEWFLWSRSEEVRMRDFLATYQDNGLQKALASGAEIMVGGNQYLAFRYETYYKLLYTYWRNVGNRPPTKELLGEIEDLLRKEMYSEIPVYEGE